VNRDELIAFIGGLSGHENIIAVPRMFVSLTDDWGVAAMLNQLIYWRSRAKRTDGFVYKSVEEWKDEVGGITRHTVDKLKELPFVETKLMKANGAPTTHYRINFDILIKLICENQQIQLSETTNPIAGNDKSLTETTTEITNKEKRNDIVLSDPQKPPDGLAVYQEDGELAPLEDRIIEIFCDRVGLRNGNRPYEHNPSQRKWYADWLKDAAKIADIEASSQEMEEAIALLKINNYSCKRPGAVIDTIKNIREDIRKFEAGEKKKIRRYKLRKVFNESIQRNEYYPEDYWLETEGAK
jgi:hypothetical protein